MTFRKMIANTIPGGFLITNKIRPAVGVGVGFYKPVSHGTRDEGRGTRDEGNSAKQITNPPITNY